MLEGESAGSFDHMQTLKMLTVFMSRCTVHTCTVYYQCAHKIKVTQALPLQHLNKFCVNTNHPYKIKIRGGGEAREEANIRSHAEADALA